MSKPNKRHTEQCKIYKQEGRRERNKAIKQERHKKRVAKAKQLREQGKAYTYKKNPYEKGTQEYFDEVNIREQKVIYSMLSNTCEFQRWKRFFGRLNRFITLAHEEERKAEIKNRKKKAVENDTVTP